MTTEPGQHQSDAISVLASVIGVPGMEQAFATYCDVKVQTRQGNVPYGDVRFAILWQLEQLFRETPSIVGVASMAAPY